MKPEQLKKIAEDLRDELTTGSDCPRIYPLALDVIATTPALCRLLAERLD